MKDKIIQTSVNLLDNLGVKFTIDDLKNELKISKKTIYKYFENKEELAQTVFNSIINNSINKQKEIVNGANDETNKLILCLLEYMEIFRLQSEKIFNLYSLNSKLQEGVIVKVEENWKTILNLYHGYSKQKKLVKVDDKFLRIIVEGIFKNISFEKDRFIIGYECLKVVIEKC